MAKPSIQFFPKAERRTIKTDKVPIYARLVLNRKKTEFRLPVEIDFNILHEWNEKFMRLPEGIDDNANRIILKFHQLFNDAVFQHAQNLDQLHVKDLKVYMLGNKESNAIKLKEFLRSFYLENQSKSNSISKGTKQNYIKALNHFDKFLSFQKKDDLLITQISPSLGSEFYDYLKKDFPQIEKKGLTDASASGNVIRIKHLLQKAFEIGVIKANPFAGLKLNTRCPKRDKLNRIEVYSIFNCDLPVGGKLEKVRDLFLFSVFTGLAYSDIVGLLKENIKSDKEGNYFLEIKRLKTGVITNQYLPKQAVDIIKKYELHVLYKNTVFPSISNQFFNETLKTLGSICSINKKISTHIARHTFRQLLAEAEIMDLAAIKTMMGHSRNNDIDSIYHNVTDKQLIAARNKLQEYLNLLLN